MFKLKKKLKRVIIFSLSFLMGFYVFLTGQPFALQKQGDKAKASAVAIDTSTSAQATANSSQRKTFFDTVNSRHWAFYYNGAAIEYAYSVDGSSWTTVATLTYNTVNFATTFKDISGTGYVFLVADCNSYDVCLRRGTLATDSINFGAEIIVFNGTSASDKYLHPTIALDGNNYVWAAGIKDFGIGYADHLQAQTRRSTNAGNGDLSSWQNATAVGRKSSMVKDLIIMPQTGSNMYLLENADTPNLVGFKYDGASWSSANEGGDYSWFTFEGGLNGSVYDIVISGTDIYFGGEFGDVGGNPNTDKIARWDGTQWRALGNGLNGTVFSIDIGANGDIFVGGYFTDAGGDPNADYIARWDGTQWYAVGEHIPKIGGSISAIAVSGNDVYIGGSFYVYDNYPDTINLAKWNGTEWTSLGSGLNCQDIFNCQQIVQTIVISGANVYIGGYLYHVGGIYTDNIARWDGAQWHALGVGLGECPQQPPVPEVACFVDTIVVNQGNVYAGGGFINAGGDPDADRIARWDGFIWHSLGDGINNGEVYSMNVFNNEIYIGGDFENAGGNSLADIIARWDGINWQDIGGGIEKTGPLDVVNSLIIPSTNNLYIGGLFNNAGNNYGISYGAFWDGINWHGISNGFLNEGIDDIAILGSDVYAIGGFINAGGDPDADRIARWDGTQWHALGNELSGENVSFRVIKAYGNNVYAGGEFFNAGGNPNADNITRWDGTQWHALGNGLNGTVFSIDIGANGDIFVGGYFTDAGGDPNADYIARWDGTQWHSLGSYPLNGEVTALSVSGDYVYASGFFIDASGNPNADGIAAWDGSTWKNLGSGVNTSKDEYGWISFVRDILESNGDIYIIGDFENAGGNPKADGIAMWDINGWNNLGDGLKYEVGKEILAINSDERKNIYIGGRFNDFNGNPKADNIARWDGTSWNNVGGGVKSFVHLGVSTIEIQNEAIYIGGYLSSVVDDNGNSFNSNYLAKLDQAAAGNIGSSCIISSVSDVSGDIHLIYTDGQNNLRHKQYSNGSWAQGITIKTGAVSNPSLSINSSSGDLYAFWIEDNKVYYQRGTPPYGQANWSSPMLLNSTGTNANVSSAQQDSNGKINVMWTNGDGSPYNVYADQVQTSEYQRSIPNGTLIRASDSPTVYLLENGQKRPVKAPSILVSQFYTWRVIVVSPSEAASYTTGSELKYQDGTLFRVWDDSKVYVVENGNKRHIPDSNTFIQMGYNWSSIVTAEDSSIADLHSTGDPISVGATHPNGSLVKTTSSPNVYYLENGQKRLIIAPSILTSRFVDWGKIIAVSQSELDSYQNGSNLTYRDGTMFMEPSGVVDVVENNKRRHIPNPQMFVDLGYSWSWIVAAENSEVVNLHNQDYSVQLPQTYPNGTLIRASDSPTVYYLEDGQKRPIRAPSILASQFYTWRVIVVSPSEAASYLTGSELKYQDGTLIKGANSSGVYVIESGNKRHIPSVQVFNSMGYNWDSIITVESDDILSLYPAGEPISQASTHPNGTLIKTSVSPSVYFLEGGQKRLILTPSILVSRFVNWNKIVIVSQEEMDSYQTGANLTYRDGTMFVEPSGAVDVVENGKKRHIPNPQMLSDLGYSWSWIVRAESSAVVDLHPVGDDINYYNK